MKKGKIMLIILVFVILFGSLSLTYTYFVMEEDTNSVVTFGNLKLKLIEKTLSGSEYVDVNDNIDITNTKKLSRLIRVKNVGNNSFYVRLKLNFIGQKGNNKFNANNLISLNIDDNWEYKDGYYYYKKEVKPKEESSNLMEEIIFDNKKILKNYQGSSFRLEVNAEAVQSENNSSNVMEATGWPN